MPRLRSRPHGVRAVLAYAVLASVIFALLAPVALGCTGGPLLDGQTYEDAAEVIFTGTAVRSDDPAFGSSGSSFDLIQWTFVVDAFEKGAVGDRFTVTSPRDNGACSYGFRLGQRYRVLAWGGEDPQRPVVIQGNGTLPILPLADPPPIEGSFTSPFAGLLGDVIRVNLVLVAPAIAIWLIARLLLRRAPNLA